MGRRELGPGEGPGEGAQEDWAQAAGPEGRKNFLLEGKLQKGRRLAKGKPSQEKKH